MFPICALGMIVYVMGIPALFGYLLYRNRKVSEGAPFCVAADLTLGRNDLSHKVSAQIIFSSGAHRSCGTAMASLKCCSFRRMR